MLQANDNNVTQLSLVTFPSIEAELAQQTSKGPCPVSKRFLELFVETTGWVAEFEESRDSVLLRKMPGMEAEPACGTISIVDMSADWPVGKPTAHRGKCDELVEVASQLISELQSTKLELTRMRSALVALSPSDLQADDEILVDSFVPKFDFEAVRPVSVDDSDFEVVDPAELAECFGGDEEDFELYQEIEISAPQAKKVASKSTLIPPPFAGWSIGGKTGISGQTYVDWRVDAAELVCLSVGKIESSFGTGDAEANLKADPLTSEFVLLGSESLLSFYYFDSATNKLSSIEFSEDWTRIRNRDAVIACTAEITDLEEVDLEAFDGNQTSPCELADIILSNVADADACVLVLKRD